MSDELKPITRLERAHRMSSQADRLYRLIDLRAPEFIIEAARMSLAKSLIRFPINEEAMQANERSDNNLWAAEQAHLHKTGYYDDINDELGDGDATQEAA